MAPVLTGPAQYIARFGEQTISGNNYALTKLGVDRAHCSLKIEEYTILCVPFQLGFKRSIFLAALSNQEMLFFQKYVNTSVGLSFALNPNKRPVPINFFLRCTLINLGQVKGRENAGLFVLEYKSTPDEMVNILGNFLDSQEKTKAQFEDYGKTSIKITPQAAKLLGFNMYATITEANSEPRRIQLITMNSKSLEHVEAVGAPVRPSGTAVTYLLFFQKYRVTVTGTVIAAGTLHQGLVRTISKIVLSPELVEILDDYWYKSQQNAKINPLRL